MVSSGLDMVKAGLWEVPADFRCRKPEFAEYLDVDAAYDQQQRMGQMYWAIRNGEILGYMMLALGHAVEERQADLGIDTYGNLPALVITRLATDERHERQGIGRQMTSHAIEIAGRMALDAGCRIILANPDRDAAGFYKKNGLRQVPVRARLWARQAPARDRWPHGDGGTPRRRVGADVSRPGN